MSKGVRRRVFVRGRRTRTCDRNEREKGKGGRGHTEGRILNKGLRMIPEKLIENVLQELREWT